MDKAFADRVVAAGGVLFPDDPYEPAVVEITEYDNAWGGRGYGLTFEGQRNRYTPSDFVGNPRVYWKKPERTAS